MGQMKQKKSVRFKVLISSAIALLIMVIGFLMFVSSSYKAESLALESLQSDSQVVVTDKGTISFEPVSQAKNIGFIFYQGAKVVPAAYAPLAKEIASNGYTVVIPKMPFNLAIFSPDIADKVINNYPEIDTWVIGGHSLGGVMASDYARRHDNVKGLVLLASYPQSETDLSEVDIQVLSLWGNRDQVADITTIKAAKKLMPSDAQFIEIKGGNHAGFGDYGAQKDDGDATITNKQQINDTATYIVELLDGI